MALKFVEEIIHQQQGDFIKVKNIKLLGTNEEIGFKLGEIAQSQHTIFKKRKSNPIKNQAQKKYMQLNYPVHYQRMRGLAKSYKEDSRTTKYDFTCFGNPMGINACSAVYYPPNFTQKSSGILSRNMDLPLLSFSSMITGAENNETPAVSNLYVVELYPDEGYPSLINLSFELYGLGLDGINSEGLTVTHLYADSVNPELYAPANEYGVGINEMLIVQLLLDNCKDVEEAKELLLRNKHFYMLLPTHLLIADRFGNSFVWEYSHNHNKEYITDGNSQIQIITNFPLFKIKNSSDFPKSENNSCPFARFKTLKNAIKENKKPTIPEIKSINARVFIRDEMFDTKPQNPVRTIYHNLYDTSQRSMEISFYRKDNGNEQLRTEYFMFKLDF